MSYVPSDTALSRKVHMANGYHNLRGWLRDLTALLKPGGDPEVLDDLMRVLADLEGEWNYYTGASTEVEAGDDDADHTVDDGAGDVEVQGQLFREEDAPLPRRDAARGAVDSTAPGRVGRELDARARSERAPSQPSIADSLPGGVGAPCGVKRTGTVELTLAQLQALQAAKRVPRGTRAAKKKGVKRGTRKTPTRK